MIEKIQKIIFLGLMLTSMLQASYHDQQETIYRNRFAYIMVGFFKCYDIDYTLQDHSTQANLYLLCDELTDHLQATGLVCRYNIAMLDCILNQSHIQLYNESGRMINQMVSKREYKSLEKVIIGMVNHDIRKILMRKYFDHIILELKERNCIVGQENLYRQKLVREDKEKRRFLQSTTNQRKTGLSQELCWLQNLNQQSADKKNLRDEKRRRLEDKKV